MNPTPKQVLDTPMESNDAGASTIRGYLVALLAGVWQHREGFNGKRPFGNSGWQYDLYQALMVAGYIAGKLDEDGYFEEVDSEAGNRLITAAINSLADDIEGGGE